jgi:hypothetical protein
MSNANLAWTCTSAFSRSRQRDLIDPDPRTDATVVCKTTAWFTAGLAVLHLPMATSRSFP